MEESLTAIAYKAGFTNLHDLASQVGVALMGSVMSDGFEMVYFRVIKGEEEMVELFGVREQNDPESCALFRVRREYLNEYIGGNGTCLPGQGGVNLDRMTPLHKGQVAANVLESYARQLGEVPPAYKWWVSRTGKRVNIL